MSSESSYQETSKNTTCHSGSHNHSCKLEPEIQPKSCDLSSPADSTCSLLSPIYHESYESEDEENEAPNKQTCRISDRVQESTSSIGTDADLNKPTVSTPKIQRESRQNDWSRKEDEHRNCNFGSSRDSTSSLLSLIYHGSYESEEKDEAKKKSANRALSRKTKCTGNRLTDTASKRRTVCTSRLTASTRKEIGSKQFPEDISLTAWEEWLIKKTKEERSEMQNKSHQEVMLKEANLKEQEKREEKIILAHEMHKMWVQEKNEKEKLENELKLCKEKITEAKEEQRRQAHEKANEKFQEWINKKKLQEREKKRKEKEDEEKQTAKMQERKEKANQVFKEWLEKAKTRPRTAPSSFGFANGKLTGYYDGTSYPAPSYCNPIPWKPIPVPRSEDVNRKVTSKKGRSISVRLYKPQPSVVIKPRDNLTVGTFWTRARLKKYS